MDFKIAGTKRGFTALQADIKIAGVPLKVIMKAIGNSNAAKSRILHIMNSVISTPASNKEENKPMLDTIQVPIHQRGKFLGIGGSNIKKILYETGVHVNLKRK